MAGYTCVCCKKNDATVHTRTEIGKLVCDACWGDPGATSPLCNHGASIPPPPAGAPTVPDVIAP